MATPGPSWPLFSAPAPAQCSFSGKPSLLWLALLSLLLFVSLALPALHQHLLPGDAVVYHAFQVAHSPFWTSFFRILTQAGSYPVLVPVALGVVVWQRTNRPLLCFLAVYTLGLPLLELGAKCAIARPRPRDFLGAGPLAHVSHDFPSGHALAAAALYGMLVVLIHRRAGSRKWQWGITGGLFLLILLIGVSRIYRAAHWPSDVLGGYALGGVYCALATAVYGWLERKQATSTLHCRPIRKEGKNENRLPRLGFRGR
jgi:membrane-associated phospholipid phosphatase